MPRFAAPFLALAALLLATPLGAQTKTVTSETITAPTAPATPVVPQTPAATAPAAPTVPASSESGVAAKPAVDGASPQIFYGEEGLPAPVKETRRKIIEATRTGDLEALRPVIEENEEPPALSGGGDGGDPIATLKLLSGDDKGREILAILQEVIEAGYVHVDIGTPQEAFVWPYFTHVPLNKLTGPQMVELFRLIAAGDFADMQEKGVYSFYRVGIDPQGEWRFFEDGD
jgi:hypothetical protein